MPDFPLDFATGLAADFDAVGAGVFLDSAGLLDADADSADFVSDFASDFDSVFVSDLDSGLVSDFPSDLLSDLLSPVGAVSALAAS